jgi:hypothetical protein
MDRKSDLLKELDSEHETAYRKAQSLEYRVDICWWGSLLFAGLASVTGFFAGVPAWLISLFASIATGLVVVRRKAGWREKSNAYYALRDKMAELISRLKYQTPDRPSDDLIARIAKERDDAKTICGRRLNQVNTLVDAVLMRRELSDD